MLDSSTRTGRHTMHTLDPGNGSQMTFDGQFFEINHTSVVSRHGLRQIRVHFSEVTRLDYSPARKAAQGYLALVTAGDQQRSGRKGLQGWDALSNPMAVAFWSKHTAQAETMRTAFEAAKYGVVPPVTVTVESTPEETPTLTNFPHLKHAVWSILTGGVWFIGYGVLWSRHVRAAREAARA